MPIVFDFTSYELSRLMADSADQKRRLAARTLSAGLIVGGKAVDFARQAAEKMEADAKGLFFLSTHVSGGTQTLSWKDLAELDLPINPVEQSEEELVRVLRGAVVREAETYGGGKATTFPELKLS